MPSEVPACAMHSMNGHTCISFSVSHPQSSYFFSMAHQCRRCTDTTTCCDMMLQIRQQAGQSLMEACQMPLLLVWRGLCLGLDLSSWPLDLHPIVMLVS